MKNIFANKPGTFRLIGFGFWQAWWMLAMCSHRVLPTREILAHSFNPVSLITLITTLGYLAIVLLSRNRSAFSTHAWAYYASGGCTAFGSIGMGLFALIPALSEQVVLYVVFASVFSFGNALLLIMWGELWSTLSTNRVGRYLCASYAFAFVLYFLILLLPGFALNVAASLLPMVSAFILRISQNEPKRLPSQIDFDIGKLAPIKVGVTVIAFGFIHGFMQGLLINLPDSSNSLMDDTLKATGLILLALVLYIVIVKPTIEPLVLYQPIFPAFVCGLILIVALPVYLGFLGNSLLLFSVYCFDMVVMLVSTDISFRTRKPVALIFGLVIFGERLGTTLSQPALNTSLSQGLLTSDTAATFILVFAVAMTLLGYFAFTQVDLLKLYIPRPARLPRKSIVDDCRHLAKVCGLTPRETEVLELLGEGRSAPYISKKLVIAQSTAKNHISSIYRKIGVYDRQSLVDVILTGTAGKGALTDSSGETQDD